MISDDFHSVPARRRGSNLISICKKFATKVISSNLAPHFVSTASRTVLKVGGSVYDPGESRRGSMNSAGVNSDDQSLRVNNQIYTKREALQCLTAWLDYKHTQAICARIRRVTSERKYYLQFERNANQDFDLVSLCGFRPAWAHTLLE
ncbi:unnamed protein product [Leptosia nina]|uniref:Uncharacterized protein n=1 Tax=Leptosia nina TaxID=320188 RepID=A0AAV1K2U7_9NEOP